MQKQGKFIGVRGLYEGQTKTGKDMISLFLSAEDLASLGNELSENATDGGVKLSIIIGVSPKTNKRQASILVSDPGQQRPQPPKKTFQYKNKALG